MRKTHHAQTRLTEVTETLDGLTELGRIFKAEGGSVYVAKQGLQPTQSAAEAGDGRASATVDEKWDGLNCHRIQFGPSNLFRRLTEPTVKQMMSKEYFALAWPEPEPGLRLADLFDGLS